MEIKHEHTAHKGLFYVDVNNEHLAEMTYVMSGEGRFIIDHTWVSDQLKGQGVGKQLVMAAVKFARDKSLKILPLCPFAKAIFDKTPEINDVLF